MKRLAAVGNALELSAALVAMTTNVPVMLVPTFKLATAEVPVGSVAGTPNVAAGGLVAGARAKVEPVRLAPVTVRGGN